MKWLWNCKCELCGYKTEFFKYQWLLYIFAFWHSVTKHPFGYCHIEAVANICSLNCEENFSDAHRGIGEVVSIVERPPLVISDDESCDETLADGPGLSDVLTIDDHINS